MAFATAGLRFLGRGVAIEVDVPGLVTLRRHLAAIWAPALTAQDAQGFRPHVTVQNKVDPAAARTLRDRLAVGFAPMEGTIEGLDLWHYRGGPWEAAGSFPFSG